MGLHFVGDFHTLMLGGTWKDPHFVHPEGSNSTGTSGLLSLLSWTASETAITCFDLVYFVLYICRKAGKKKKEICSNSSGEAAHPIVAFLEAKS